MKKLDNAKKPDSAIFLASFVGASFLITDLLSYVWPKLPPGTSVFLAMAAGLVIAAALYYQIWRARSSSSE